MVATPGISSGYWNARNRPAAARSSGAMSNRFLPLNSTSPAGRRVVGLAGEHIGQRRFARAVRAHDRMHLARIHGEVEAFENFLAVDLDVQIFDFKQRHRTAYPFYPAVFC